jgi:hypothetical protein
MVLLLIAASVVNPEILTGDIMQRLAAEAMLGRRKCAPDTTT